ncbi:MAG: hypothetical protein KGL39_31155 [Patescibacteria group bacterium]|nr:hypothetical protein [Patescibacteria group bacterium]
MPQSSRAKGNAFENHVIDFLEARGWYCYASRGSRGLDITAIAPKDSPLPHLGIEAGTKNKRARGAFKKMRESPQCPGMILLVARKMLVKRRITILWHVEGVLRGMAFDAALERARAA